MVHFKVKPLSGAAYFADALMSPIMLLVSGALAESPQETHFWNNQKYQRGELAGLDPEQLAVCPGIPGAKPAYLYGLPMMHLPLIGGWRYYVVLEVTKDVTWYLGWRTGRVCGVSQIPIAGNRVRALLGGDSTEFFAISEHGDQLLVRSIWQGIIGSGGPFCRLPLR